MKTAKKILFIFILFVFSITSVNALTNFSISNIDTVDNSATIFIEDVKFNDLDVDSNITFYELDDYVVYELSLRNNTKYDYYIKNITDDNSDPHISVSYQMKNDKNIIKKSEDAILVVKFSLDNDLSTSDILAQDNLYYFNKLNIIIESDRIEEINNNPKTYDYIIKFILVLLFAAVGMFLIIKYHKEFGLYLFLIGVITLGYNVIFVSAKETKFIEDNIIITFKGANIKVITPQSKWYTYVGGPVTKENIQTIRFVAWSEVPEHYNGSFDISVNQDESVIEFYVLDTSTNLYDIYIASPFGYSRYYKSDTRTFINEDNTRPYMEYFDYDEGLFSYLPNMKLIDFKYLDTYEQTNFGGFLKMINLEILEESGVEYINFSDHSSLTSISFGDRFYTRNITDFKYAFAGLDKLETIDVSGFDVRNAESLACLFKYDYKLNNIIGLENWDTSNVKDFSEIFHYDVDLHNVSVDNWNTSNGENMFALFAYSGINKLDLSKWNTSKVKNFSSTFEALEDVTELKVEDFDVSSATDISYMFSEFKSDIDLDLSRWNISNVENMIVMFDKSKFNKLNISTWDVSRIKDFSSLFSGIELNEDLDLSRWNTESLEILEYTFQGTDMSHIKGFEYWDTSHVTSLYVTFYEAIGDDLDLSRWVTSNVTNSFMTFRFSTFKNIDFRHLDLSNSLDVTNMFSRMSNLENVYVENNITYNANAVGKDFVFVSSAKNGYTIKDYN